MPDHSENAMTPFGEIHLPSKKYDEIKDFYNGSIEQKRWFMHEMAHVWQYFAMDICVACRGVDIAMKGGYSQKTSVWKINGICLQFVRSRCKEGVQGF